MVGTKGLEPLTFPFISTHPRRLCVYEGGCSSVELGPVWIITQMTANIQPVQADSLPDMFAQGN